MNISDEALNAAFETYYANTHVGGPAACSAAIRAAASFIAAQAWDEGAAASTYPDGSRVEAPHHLPPNPYRS